MTPQHMTNRTDHENKWRVLLLVGPTAVGKTAVSIPLAERLNAEIVSADSRQIYKYMDIGTAKPTPEEQRGIRHHLVDTLDPSEKYTAGRFARDAREIIDDILNREKTPLVVGGAGLYIKALVHGLFDKSSRDKQVRRDLKARVKQEGIEPVYEEFREIDPEYARDVHINDEKKILRALEIYKVTGKTPTEHFNESPHTKLPYRYEMIGLNMDRKRLYQRINQRVEDMVEQGLVDEVKGLPEKGYTGEENALQTVGYQEIFAYLDVDMTLQEAIERIQINTRHYAKRQLTWFRNQHDVTWFRVDEYDSPEEVAGAILDYLGYSS